MLVVGISSGSTWCLVQFLCLVQLGHMVVSWFYSRTNWLIWGIQINLKGDWDWVRILNFEFYCFIKPLVNMPFPQFFYHICTVKLELAKSITPHANGELLFKHIHILPSSAAILHVVWSERPTVVFFQGKFQGQFAKRWYQWVRATVCHPSDKKNKMHIK